MCHFVEDGRTTGHKLPQCVRLGPRLTASSVAKSLLGLSVGEE